jgi:hypothetical protein
MQLSSDQQNPWHPLMFLNSVMPAWAGIHLIKTKEKFSMPVAVQSQFFLYKFYDVNILAFIAKKNV